MSLTINNTFNGSLLDEDVLLVEENDSSYSYKRPMTLKIFYNIEFFAWCIKTLIYILALASNLYLIVVISKFKNLRKRRNFFILQYAIFNITYLVMMVSIIIILLTDGGYKYNINFIINLDHLYLTLSNYVLLVMAIDWYVLNFYCNIYHRYPKVLRYGLYMAPYIFGIPKWIVTSVLCFTNSLLVCVRYRILIDFGSYFFCICIIVYISIAMRKRVVPVTATKNNYAVAVPRIVFIWALPLYVFRVIHIFLNFHMSPTNFGMLILFVFFYISECLFYAIPIVIVYQLIKLNKQFKAAYFKSCRKKMVDTYNDDNLDSDDENDCQSNNVTYFTNTEVVNL